MPSPKFLEAIKEEITTIKSSGLFKNERILITEQQPKIKTNAGKEVLNFCSNNYLNLCSNEEIKKAAINAVNSLGYGLSSVRFICGTQSIHIDLEKKISQFFQTDDTILFSSCFEANGAVFQALLTDQDAVFTDKLNHASIIDGIRLCKAKKNIYEHLNMKHLETLLKESTARFKIIATDGVFSMDGDIAPLDKICELAEKYDSLVFVDDSHATGFLGKTGRGTPEIFNVMNKIDILTSTLGKALGGATGGFVTGRKEIIEFLRQRGRPYLFSNSLAPMVAGGSLKAFDLIMKDNSKVEHLNKMVKIFRTEMIEAGFKLSGHIDCPIVPIMLYDSKKSVEMAEALLEKGIYCISFSYPVVPKGEARIRIQLSSGHTEEMVKFCANAFTEVGKKMKIIE